MIFHVTEKFSLDFLSDEFFGFISRKKSLFLSSIEISEIMFIETFIPENTCGRIFCSTIKKWKLIERLQLNEEKWK